MTKEEALSFLYDKLFDHIENMKLGGVYSHDKVNTICIAIDALSKIKDIDL